jgi:hypothetical protein
MSCGTYKIIALVACLYTAFTNAQVNNFQPNGKCETAEIFCYNTLTMDTSTPMAESGIASWAGTVQYANNGPCGEHTYFTFDKQRNRCVFSVFFYRLPAIHCSSVTRAAGQQSFFCAYTPPKKKEP